MKNEGIFGYFSRNKFNNSRVFVILILLLLFTLFNIVRTQAYLLTPPKIEYNFDPNQIVESSFTIINRDQVENNLIIYIEGDLNQSFVLSENSTIVPAQSSKSISFKIFFPETLKPGTHLNKIIVEEVLPETEQGIGAKVAIGILVPIMVPYPGKYLTADLFANSINLNEIQDFKIRLYNLGKEEINSIDITLFVYNPNKESIAKLTEKASNFGSNSIRDVIIKWNSTNNNPGIYEPIANITYDGIKTSAVTKFRIGDLIIRIKDITYSKVKKGTISKINVLLENLWTGPVENVYGQLDVLDSGIVVSTSKSESFMMESASEKDLSLFVDATKLDAKEYEGKITIFYSNKTSQRLFKLVVGQDFLNKVFILEALIIIAIIVLLALISLNYRKIFKKKTEE